MIASTVAIDAMWAAPGDAVYPNDRFTYNDIIWLWPSSNMKDLSAGRRAFNVHAGDPLLVLAVEKVFWLHGVLPSYVGACLIISHRGSLGWLPDRYLKVFK